MSGGFIQVTLAATAALAAVLAACDLPPDYAWELPPGYEPPPVPDGNPMSADKVELGRRLFHDTRLSANGRQACASCHVQAHGFAEERATSVGSTGEALPRNAPGLVNLGYFGALTWANPLMTTLERQVVVPMFSDAPVELGLAGREDEVLERLRADPDYRELFARAFPGQRDPFTIRSVIWSLAAFVRTLIAADSPYDRWLRGDEGALDAAARRGRDLFFSERLGCGECHSGTELSAAATPEVVYEPGAAYANVGLYNIDGSGAYPTGDAGLVELTGRPEDSGKFRIPSLRNVAVTAPYMHDGSVATLEEVVQIFEAGGRVVDRGPDAGDGRANPHKDPRIRPFALTDSERDDLLRFLASLTDESFLTDPRFSDPYE